MYIDIASTLCRRHVCVELAQRQPSIDIALAVNVNTSNVALDVLTSSTLELAEFDSGDFDILQYSCNVDTRCHRYLRRSVRHG